MKTKMKLAFGLLATALVLSTANAQEVDDSQLSTVKYEDTAYTYRDFEIARSVLKGKVTCAKTAADAKQAADKILKMVETGFDAEMNEGKFVKIKLDLGKPTSMDPVVDAYVDATTGKPEFYDVCEKEILAHHEKRSRRWKVSYKVTMTAPLSQGDEITTVVRGGEAFADTVDNATLECTTAEPFSKGVSEETANSAWQQLEVEAEKGADEKRLRDANEYAASWPEMGQTGFSRKSSGARIYSGSGVPAVAKDKKSGEWVGKVSINKSFNVKFKALSEQRAGKPALSRSGTKSYRINTSVETQDGLFGVFTVTLSQSCFDTKDEARDALKMKSDEWREELRKLFKKNEAHPEMNRVDLERTTVVRDNRVKTAKRPLPGERYNVSVYSACDPQTVHTSGKIPEDVVYYTASVTHTIQSPELEKLSSFGAAIDPVFDVTQLSTKTAFTGKISQKVLVELEEKLRADAIAKFMDSSEGSFWQDSRELCFGEACIVDAGMAKHIGFGGGARRSATESSMDVANEYNEGSVEGISLEEEGKQLFMGTYTYAYKVYWPLIEAK